MVKELKIQTNGLNFDGRARIFFDRTNITNNVQKVLLIMERDKPTEVMLVMKSERIDIDVKVIKSGNLIDKIINRFTSANTEKISATKTDTRAQENNELEPNNQNKIV